MKKFYITTPIYYPSGDLHIGHAYTTIIADLMSRYKKQRGYEVFYLTGTDEHGEKIQTKAQEAGMSEMDYLDEMIEKIKLLWSDLGIDYDKFIRTTDKDHVKVIQKIFQQLLDQGDIYLGQYEGFYCTPCESFWTETQLDENGNCPDCGRPVQTKKEESYFFNMKKYDGFINDLYENRSNENFFLQPVSRSNEMFENFIKNGVQDLAVSRTSFNWGVPIGNTKHVVYVWLDALCNYISALGYQKEEDELFNKFWGTKSDPSDTEIVHLVGKEIVRFHGIYWPIFLEALNLRQPSKLYAHGWLVMKDGKMSKSKGNVIDPHKIIKEFGSDAIRFYLMKEINFGGDGVFTPELFIESYNANLVNSLSNLVHRTQTMFLNNFGTKLEGKVELGQLEEEVINYSNEKIAIAEVQFDNFQINKAIDTIFEIITRLNKYIDETTPWALAKDEKTDELANVLGFLAEMIANVSILLRPVLPDTANKISERFELKENLLWEDAKQIGNFANVVNEKEGIFNRIKLSEGIEKLQ